MTTYTYAVYSDLNVVYEGPSKLSALRAYIREARKPFKWVFFLVNGVPTCPRHGQPLEEGFVDGGGGWHPESSSPGWNSHPQTYYRPRCWECDPYGSFPNEPLPHIPEDEVVLEDLLAKRAERSRRSLAGQLRRIAESFNAAMHGEGEQ